MTLTSASTGAYSGSYDVVLDSADHVTGSFSAMACSGMNLPFGWITGTGPIGRPEQVRDMSAIAANYCIDTLMDAARSLASHLTKRRAPNG